jgi:hypothetical protein
MSNSSVESSSSDANELEFVAAADLLAERGANTRFWSNEQAELIQRSRRGRVFLSNLIYVAVYLLVVGGWLSLIVFDASTNDQSDAASEPAAQYSTWQIIGFWMYALTVLGLALAAILSIAHWVALRTALLVVPFDRALTALQGLREHLRSADVDRWSNTRDGPFGMWHRSRLRMRIAPLRQLRVVEQALLSRVATGRIYRTIGARDAERRDRARVAATVSWIEMGLLRKGDPFKEEAIVWLAAIQLMIAFRDWTMTDLPGEDTGLDQPTVISSVRRILYAGLALFFAAVPVVGQLAPSLLPTIP